MEKAIYFDMDGTIADFYAVRGWKTYLKIYSDQPYRRALPMWNTAALKGIIRDLKEAGYTVGIITWLSKETTPEYDKKVREAKKHWLKKYGLWDLMDEVHMVKYGTPKHLVANHRKTILVDDNSEVRERWMKYGGTTINPIGDLFKELKVLL